MVDKVTEKNFCRILDDFVEQIKERAGDAWAHEWLEEVLDQYLADDFFGTEGQCDPRGDHRE